MIRRLGLAIVVILTTVSLAIACGTERWPVKIAADGDAGKIDTTPKETNIAALRDIGAPVNPNVRRRSRYAPTELTTFKISGTLTVIKPEADEDYHLVIRDNRGRTMIIESPEPTCAENSRFLSEITEVRRVLDAKFPSLSSKLTPNIAITA